MGNLFFSLSVLRTKIELSFLNVVAESHLGRVIFAEWTPPKWTADYTRIVGHMRHESCSLTCPAIFPAIELVIGPKTISQTDHTIFSLFHHYLTMDFSHSFRFSRLATSSWRRPTYLR